MNLDGYDFLDFGASKGGSIDFAIRRLGGTRGLGIDKKPKKVELMSKAGYDCMQADVTKLDYPSDSVRFVVMSHFLEHLPDLSVAEAAIKSAARVATDFLFIRGPYFDADEYLRAHGLKFYWSDWPHGHPCHLTTAQLRKILLDMGLEDYVMMGCQRITDSSNPAIHPLNSPINQRAYDSEVHSDKPFVRFHRPIYREIVCYVRLRPVKNWKDILRAREGCEQLDTDGKVQISKRQKPYVRSVLAALPRVVRTSLFAGGLSKKRSEQAPTRSRNANKSVAPPLPTFLIIGAQKSATRWLRTNLGAHPQVFTADTESHFFSRSRYFRLGLDYYRTHFEGWDGEPVVGEATPGYMMWIDDPPTMAARIDESLPNVRLLALLRIPVDRTYSAFIHHMRQGRIPADAGLLGWVRSVAPKDDPQGLIAGGWYAASLTPYFERFGERLQVFLHDDVVDHPKRVYSRALEHIGASPDFVPPELERVVFSNRPPKPSAYHEGKGGRRKLSSEERAELYEYFRHDIDHLEELLGRDLSIWRPSS